MVCLIHMVVIIVLHDYSCLGQPQLSFMAVRDCLLFGRVFYSCEGSYRGSLHVISSHSCLHICLNACLCVKLKIELKMRVAGCCTKTDKTLLSNAVRYWFLA